MIETDPILKPHFKAFVFEIDAPASDKPIQQVFLAEIAKSDIYLLLIGDKYGFCKDGEFSPTEQEYDKAQELGLTKLVMVRGKDISNREEREARFLDKVSEGRVRIRYQDPDAEHAVNDLLDEVRNSLRDIMLDDGVLSKIPFEDQAPADVTMDDISTDRIQWFVKSAVRNRKTNYLPGMSASDILRSLHLLNRQTGKPTKSAVLLFGREPQYFFPASLIKCACYSGTEKTKPTLDVSFLEGDLFHLADQAIAYVNAHIDQGAGEHQKGATADEIPEIPNAVVAEAVNNAIAHRNYANSGSIQIEIYRDRVEISNPGRLHPFLSIEDLYKKHESYPPNARIAHALYQVKYIEALGTGITDMIKRCAKAGLRRPKFEEISGRFRIILWRKDKKRAKQQDLLMFETLVLAFLKERNASGAKLADLHQLAPNLSRGLCQSIMRKLRKMGKIRLEGNTSAARWFYCD